jgi:hypothetical protein
MPGLTTANPVDDQAVASNILARYGLRVIIESVQIERALHGGTAHAGLLTPNPIRGTEMAEVKESIHDPVQCATILVVSAMIPDYEHCSSGLIGRIKGNQR